MAVPFYRGPLDLARKYLRLHRFLARNLVQREAIYGARVPNILGALVQKRANRLGAIFIAQVVGDPEDVLRAGAAGTIGRWSASLARRVVARQVARASAVIYVTRRTLQAKYPAHPGAPVLIRSNVELNKQSFAPSPRNYEDQRIEGPVRIVAAGSQEQLYKGHQTLIDATAILVSRGIAVQTTLIGDGKFHDQLAEQAHSQGVADHIIFAGHLQSADLVREQILRNDVFAMPSLTEGLPRVLIEAMAAGVLCIGSRVGGIPELLPERCLFSPASAEQIATVVAQLVENPREMTELASQQWNEARLISQSYSGANLLGQFFERIEST